MEEYMESELSSIFQVKLVVKNMVLGIRGPISRIWELENFPHIFI